MNKKFTIDLFGNENLVGWRYLNHKEIILETDMYYYGTKKYFDKVNPSEIGKNNWVNAFESGQGFVRKLPS